MIAPPISLLVSQNVHCNTSLINFQSGLEQTAVIATGNAVSANQWLRVILPFFNKDILNVTMWSHKDLFTPRLYQKFTYCKLFLVLH